VGDQSPEDEEGGFLGLGLGLGAVGHGVGDDADPQASAVEGETATNGTRR